MWGSGGRGLGELLSEAQATNPLQAMPKSLASTLWPWGPPRILRSVWTNYRIICSVLGFIKCLWDCTMFV